MADLEIAIQRSQEALDATPADHPDRASRLHNLGIGYRSRYRRTGAMADLEKAIQRSQEGLDTTPVDHPDRASRLHNLGIGYDNRYRRVGAIADLEKAIQRCQEALDITPADHPDRASRLDDLGIGYRSRYRRTGAMADLERAIQRYQEALDITPADHPDRAGRLHNLGIGYDDRYRRVGATADLETAIQRHQEALDATPTDHPDRADRLNILGIAYCRRYRRTGAIADLERAIQRCQEALDITPANHPDRAGRLHNLGIGYDDRYRRTGITADLETAIQRLQEALDVTPADHPDRAGRLNDLGIEYRSRYRRTGAMADLERAIQRSQEALDATPADHPDRAGRLDNLATGYYNKYRRTGAMADLDRAIQQCQEGLNTTPGDHPDRAGRLRNLGAGYNDKYRRTGAMADLDRAIQRSQESLDATPADHPDRAGRLNDLGIEYRSRYRRTGAMADLERAIQRSQEALDATPADHLDRADRLNSLGIGYDDRYRRTGAIADLERAIQRSQEALDQSSSPVNSRLEAGRALLVLLAGAQNWPRAHDAASKAVSLVPLLTPRSLETSDKQHLLMDIVNLASMASAVALNAAKTPSDAVQALESGRGVIAGSINELRTDVSDLQQKHPQLAKEYVTLRDQIDSPAMQMQRKVDQRYTAGKELERVIQQIQRLPEFHRFLCAPSEDELKAAAECGPIVIINWTDYRCDALIIEKTQIRALQLPHLRASDIRAHVTEASSEPEALAKPGVLEWLWNTIARPVLDTLGFTQTPSTDRWPHIWWIPTGLLAKFPIHAAGYQSQSSSDAVIDRVISSYSSSVKAIIHGRRHHPQPTRRPSSEKVILLAMHKTPCYPDLRFATQEIQELERLCSSMDYQVSKPPPYKEQVLPALNDCNIFHFAGHGCTDESDPAKSHLVLQDWQTKPLTVASLLETNLRKQAPFLAYLSACGTGRIERDHFLDESLHLISAYQLAGFRHVIGTLWKVNDESCKEMSTTTYKWMQDHGMSDESVSEGLHHASRSLRKQLMEENSARKALRRVKGLDDDQMAVQRSDPSQDKAVILRDCDLDEDTKPVQPYWVPYVHFGV